MSVFKPRAVLWDKVYLLLGFMVLWTFMMMQSCLVLSALADAGAIGTKLYDTLGDGTTNERYTPVQTGSGDVITAALRESHNRNIENGITPIVSDDFKSDGRPDIVYRHPETGKIGVWMMNGITETSWQYISNHGAQWDIKGVADFNTDGQPDIVYRHLQTGKIGAWMMNGITETSWQYIGNHGAQWDIKGVADFNGDGQPDIVYRHSDTGKIGVWLMNGNSETSWKYIGNHGAYWDIKGVADFNSDGHPDIVYRHSDTGKIGVWLMNGNSETSWKYIGNHGAYWDIKGVADFNRDGQPDIVYRHSDTGKIGVWLMNGNSETSWKYIGNHGAYWDINGLGDFGGIGGNEMSPSFPGIMLMASPKPDSLSLSWLSATDDSTSPEDMVYKIYVSQEDYFQPNADNLYTKIKGKTQFEIIGLKKKTTYYVLIIAADESGFQSPERDYMSGTTLSTPIEYNPNNNFELSEDLKLGVPKIENSNYIFIKTSNSQLPTVGNILIGESDDGGYLRRVDAVSATDTQIIVNTSDAYISDIISNGSIRNTFKMINPEKIAKSSSLSSNVINLNDSGKRYTSIRNDEGSFIAEQTTYTPLQNPSTAPYNATIVDGGLTLNLDIDYEPNWKNDITWSLSEGFKGSQIVAEGPLSFSASASLNVSAGDTLESEHIIFLKTYHFWHKIPIPVFPFFIPVYQEATFLFKVEYSLNSYLDFNASAKKKWSRHFKVGLLFDKKTNKFYPISTAGNISQKVETTVDLAGGISLEVRLVPQIEVSFYRIAYAGLSAEPYINMEIDAVANDPNIIEDYPENPFNLKKFDITIGAGIYVWANLKLPIGVSIESKRLKVYELPPYTLFSLPSIHVESYGFDSNTSIAQAQGIVDQQGVNNAFDDSSIKWNLYPPGQGNIIGDGYNVQIELIIPANQRELWFSGYGKNMNGSGGRQFVSVPVTADCSISGTYSVVQCSGLYICGQSFITFTNNEWLPTFNYITNTFGENIGVWSGYPTVDGWLIAHILFFGPDCDGEEGGEFEWLVWGGLGCIESDVLLNGWFKDQCDSIILQPYGGSLQLSRSE